mgnify:CR=1 FL=1
MRRIGLGLFIIGITFAKAYGQEDYGPVNTGAANYLTIPADARSAAMGGVGVAAPGGDHAVFHNGAAALSDVTRRGGLLILILHGCVTMSPDTLFIAWVVFTKSISVMPFC